MIPPSAEPNIRASNPDIEVFVCTLESFPQGTAQTNKLGLFARALQSQSIPVRIFLLDAREDIEHPRNPVVSGIWHGIPYEYTAGRTTRAPSLLLRSWLKIYALLAALWRMRAHGPRRLAVFFVHDAARLMMLLAACRLMGIRTVIDLCEWMPSMPDPTRANRWGYETGAVFRLLDGVIPISRLLEKRVRDIAGKRALPSFYLSNLIDPTEFQTFGPSPETRPYILWAGSTDQYTQTVYFVVQAFAQVHQAHPELVLVLCGGGSADIRASVLAYADEQGVPQENISITGFVSRRDLLDFYGGAQALLAPLEDDERSRARFPFKLGEYLLTGRPVVSSRVGDVPDYLDNGVNAMLAEAEDPHSFAACINQLLDDPERSVQIGLAGSVVARQRFDYRTAAPRITAFLQEIADRQ